MSSRKTFTGEPDRICKYRFDGVEILSESGRYFNLDEATGRSLSLIEVIPACAIFTGNRTGGGCLCTCIVAQGRRGVNYDCDAITSIPFVFGSVRTGLANRLVLASMLGMSVYLFDQIFGKRRPAVAYESRARRTCPRADADCDRQPLASANFLAGSLLPEERAGIYSDMSFTNSLGTNSLGRVPAQVFRIFPSIIIKQTIMICH